MKKILGGMVMLFLSACAVGPDFESPEAPEINTYTEEPLPQKTQATENVHAGAAQSFNIDKDIPADWWTLFHSPELNALIEHGIKNSPTLRSAVATLEQAEQNLYALIGMTMVPDVTANYTQIRQQIPPFGLIEGVSNQFPGNSFINIAPGPFYLFSGTVNVSYTLDVFGGNRRAIEALRAQMDYQRYQLIAAYLSLTSNIATTAVLEASLREQIKATEEIIAIEEKQLAINRKQLALGGIANTAVLAQEAQLAQTQATLPPLETNLIQARNALAVLVGDYPGNHQLPIFELKDLHLPTELPVSLPSDLIRQRPDVQAAEALLHAATAQIGVATANLLPTFPITGAYATETGTFSTLFSPGSFIWDWQVQVVQTIFNGGANWFQRKAAIAGFQAAMAQYQVSVLNALQNVSNVLKALQSDAQTLQATALAEKSAKQTLEITQQQYKLGGVGYLNVLSAETQYQQAYISRIQAEAARYSDTAALFQAMGGGWWHREEWFEDDE